MAPKVHPQTTLATFGGKTDTATDFIDGNLKIMSGLLWTLILRFTISGIQVDGLSAKEGLLLWCQRKTQGYAGVDVVNFTSSWTDGLAFCALLCKYRSDVLDYHKLNKSDHRGNTALAFRIAEEHVNIPALLSVDDVCDVTRPDERSVMTYIAQFFHAFAHLDKVGNAGRRIEKFAEAMQSATTMQHDFERRMKALCLSIEAIQSAWRASYFTGTYDDAKRQSIEFSDFKKTKKRSWVREKSALEALLGNIQTKLQSYKLRPYAPPAQYALQKLEERWVRLLAAEAKQAQSINSKIRDVKEALRTSFASKANDFAHMLNVLSTHLAELAGDLEAQLESVANLVEHIGPLQAVLSEISGIAEECGRANIEENDHTIYTFDDIDYQFRLVTESVLKKQKFIETQIVARSKSNVTAGQLEEIDAIFQHFDRNCSDALLLEDFGAAVASLGLVYEAEELENVFQGVVAKSRYLKMQKQVQRGLQPLQNQALSRPVSVAAHRRTGSTMTRSGSVSPMKRQSQYDTLSGAASTVSYDGFLDFMLEQLEDQNSPEQVLNAFKDVAAGQLLVTESDLRRSQIAETAVSFLVHAMPASRNLASGGQRQLSDVTNGAAPSSAATGNVDEEADYDYTAYMSTLLSDDDRTRLCASPAADQGLGIATGKNGSGNGHSRAKSTGGSTAASLQVDSAQKRLSRMTITTSDVGAAGRTLAIDDQKENRPRSYAGSGRF